MTKGYFLVNYNIHDQEMFSQYLQPAQVIVAKYVTEGKAKILAAETQLSQYSVEGTPSESLFLVEFESIETAREFYNSASFQDIINLRLSSTKGWAAIFPEFNSV